VRKVVGKVVAHPAHPAWGPLLQGGPVQGFREIDRDGQGEQRDRKRQGLFRPPREQGHTPGGNETQRHVEHHSGHGVRAELPTRANARKLRGKCHEQAENDQGDELRPRWPDVFCANAHEDRQLEAAEHVTAEITPERFHRFSLEGAQRPCAGESYSFR